MGGHHILDLVRVDVEAGHENHVLLAIDDVEIAAFIHAPDIAGTQPAIGGDGLGGFFGALPIAGHDLRPTDADFAHLALRQQIAVIVLD